MIAVSLPRRPLASPRLAPAAAPPAELARRRAALLPGITRLATLLDSAFTIPLIGVRVGLDPLIGLIPGVGDVLGLFLSLEIIRRAWRAGAPTRLLMKMGANVALDAALGITPILGDALDVLFKANQRNVALVRRWLQAEGG